MWECRTEAVAALEGPLRPEAATIDAGFALLDRIILRLAEQPPENAYARTNGLIVVKLKHFGRACFSLALDGLAQESGAILRTWIEALELLRYLSTDPEPPERLEKLWTNKLPGAGKIAQSISGHFQALRDMLADTAAHFRMRPESLHHVLDPRTGEIRGEQRFSEEVLRANLTTCFYFLYFSAVESLVPTGFAGVPNEDLGAELDAWFAQAGEVFPTAPAA